MRTELTPNQIAFHRENGYLVIEDFLTPDELAEWRDAIDEAVAARESKPIQAPRPEDPSSKTDYIVNTFLQVINIWKDSERVRSLVLDERIGRMAAELEGVEGYRMWHDQALIKDVTGSGRRLYRTHGKGYILVRHGDTHTWAVDDGYFMDQAQEVRDGCDLAFAGIFDTEINTQTPSD